MEKEKKVNDSEVKSIEISSCENEVLKRLKLIYGFDEVSVVDYLRDSFGGVIGRYREKASIKSMFIGIKNNKVYLFDYQCFYNINDSELAIFNHEYFNVIDTFDDYIYNFEDTYYIFSKGNKYIVYYIDFDVDKEEYKITTKEFDRRGIKIPGRLSLPEGIKRTIIGDINYNFLSLLDNEIYLNTVRNPGEIETTITKIGKLPEDGVITRIEPLDNNRNDSQAFDMLFSNIALGLIYEDGTKRLLIMRKDGSDCSLTRKFDNIFFTSGFYCRNEVLEDGTRFIEAYPGLLFDYQIGNEIGTMEIDDNCDITYYPIDSVKASERYNRAKESIEKYKSYFGNSGLDVLKSDTKTYVKK